MTPVLVTRLLASARSGAIAIDHDGRIVLLNEAARRLLDLPASVEPGSRLVDALGSHPTLARLLADAVRPREVTGTPVEAETETVLVAGGQARTVGFTVHAARDDAGHPIGALVLLKALSRVETGPETACAQERLAEVGAMAGAIAHQMRNPLVGIRLSAGMLRRRLAMGPNEAALLDEIVAEVGKLEDTVNRCLVHLRPLSLSHQAVLVNDVVQEALALCEASLAERAGRVAVRLELSDRLPPVNGDAYRLREAIANLITNALEAMEEAGGTLELATALLDSSAAVGITVSDTGPGIAPDLLEKVFYPFFTTKVTGSGLGLATVQKIVTGHGGSIEVSSDPSRGTRFRVVLPAGQGEAAGRRERQAGLRRAS